MEFRCGHIKIGVLPRERSREQPESVRYEVDVVVSHPTGAFQYQADDIYVEVGDLTGFGRGLESLIAGATSEALLSCMSKYFRLRVTRNGSVVGLAVEIEEYVPNAANPKLIGSSVEDNGELLSRWREHIRDELSSIHNSDGIPRGFTAYNRH